MIKNMKIDRADMVDALLARSALCGDITGRGSMLDDNDDAALSRLMDVVVPALLAGAGLEATATDDGWIVCDRTGMADAAALPGFVLDGLSHLLWPDRFGAAVLPSAIPDVRLAGYD